MVGINPARRRRARCWLGVPITSDGIEGLLAMDGFEDIAVVFDATSTGPTSRMTHDSRLISARVVVLTPATKAWVRCNTGPGP